MTKTELRELANKWRRAAEYFREHTDEYAYEEKTLAAANVLEDCADELVAELQVCAECGEEADLKVGGDYYCQMHASIRNVEHDYK